MINDGPVDVGLVANQAGRVAVGRQGLERHRLEMFKQVPIALVSSIIWDVHWSQVCALL